ncbi:glycosyltransferase [Hoylesella timonensis]|uniref:Glycosyltransferase, group 2 family protein n=1 Tax=Hoylesella timonensis CRIS 5C-B1 TaxID=679189 RepID=D1W1V6_9BACT|nr:glycosyltransferase family 2 protein [Hoylesella timonensis]EFA96640.1 glycosyltransferase, group 2 family protein [Hoylesella timonensis CRIS 5C-B1]
MEIKVSIVIPVYKVEKYIERCLRSVFNQTYANIECIIVNDCTPDNSFIFAKELVESYQGSINFKFVEHEKNKGLSEARNTGIKMATGHYYFFLDSDDAIPPTSIEKLIETALLNDCPEIVMGVTKGVDANGNNVEVSSAQTKSFHDNSEVFQGYLNNLWYVIACNKLVKKDIFADHKTFFMPGITHEDVMWSFEISTYVNKIILCPFVTYHYYIGDTDSISRSVWNTKRVNDSITILERKAIYLERVSDRKGLARHIKNEGINIIYSLFRNGFSNDEIKKFMKRIVQLNSKKSIKEVRSDVLIYRRAIYYLYRLL